MELPFGKKVSCGNYYVLKHTKGLSKSEVKKMRDAQGVPDELRKHLTRGTLPVITVSTVSDSWRIEFIAGMGMYEAIDALPVAVDGEGHYTYYGETYKAMGNIINGWFAYTSTVGDDQYMADVIRAMQDYLQRASEKNAESLPEKDTEHILDEDRQTEKARSMLDDMSSKVMES